MANPNIPPGPGRPKGIPNKSTIDAREAIASFVDGNVERLEGWLDTIAEGIPDKKDETGTVTKWLRDPDPDAAFKAYMSVIEYHIPKLARSEHTGKNGEALFPQKVEIVLVAAKKVGEDQT